jgi:hypothetical protein
MRNKILLSSVFLFFFILTIFNLKIPFFWDGTFFSELSVHFYENGFNGFVPPTLLDNGGIHLYSVYLTIAWKLFGKTLAVSHFALLPFIWGIAYEYFKLAKRFLSGRALLFSMILLVAEPCFITQSILMGYDILMIYFFFLSLNALIDKNKYAYPLALVLLCCCNVRGIMLSVALLFIDIAFAYSSTKTIRFKFQNYLFALITIVVWGMYHYEKTGWFFFSPERENTHESFLPASLMFHQFLFISWKTADFGRLLLWLFVFAGSIYFYKRQNNTDLKLLLKFVFIPFVVLSLFMIPLANPIGHKYFIVVFLCLNIVVCFLFQQFENKKMQLLMFSVLTISLISGNFYLYPERFGNGWDSSLKVLPYFDLKEKMDDFIQRQHINPNEVGTQYPLIADKRFSHLADSSYHYTNVWSGPINNYNYFLQTNVINTDISEQIALVKKDWILLKEYRKGQVYISLYKNNEK